MFTAYFYVALIFFPAAGCGVPSANKIVLFKKQQVKFFVLPTQ